MGVNQTTRNFEKSYILPANEYTHKVELVDTLSSDEFYNMTRVYTYIKFEGIQILAYPDSSKQRLYMSVRWDINANPESIGQDDNTKVLTWPKISNQAYYFRPPNVALKFPQTSSEYVRVNLQREWLHTQDMRVALTENLFPCEIYFGKIYDTAIDIKITARVEFRRSITDVSVGKVAIKNIKWITLKSDSQTHKKQDIKTVCEEEEDSGDMLDIQEEETKNKQSA